MLDCNLKNLKMKRFITIILLTTGLIGGCKKALDEKVYGSIGSLTSVQNITNATVGIYQALDPVFGNYWVTNLYPMVETGHRYSSYGIGETLGNRDFYRFIYSANNAEFETIWNTFYRTVNRSNEVIEAAEKISDTTISYPLIAEAKFLRGWSYFILTLSLIHI